MPNPVTRHMPQVVATSFLAILAAATLAIGQVPNIALANDDTTAQGESSLPTAQDESSLPAEQAESVEEPSNPETEPEADRALEVDSQESLETTPEAAAPTTSVTPPAEIPSSSPATETPGLPSQVAPEAVAEEAPVAKAVGPSGGTKRFSDVQPGHQFYAAIAWMYNEGLTSGVSTAQGKVYLPKQQLTREAMAAFLYRQAGSPKFTMPKSRFVDVPINHKFYKPIMWMKTAGLTTGVNTPQGKAYMPKNALSREAMAAFLYRAEGSPSVSGVVFPDVPRNHKFYKAITWMKKSGLTTGIKQPNGKIYYKPSDRITREAMAAFLYRQSGSPRIIESGKTEVTGTLQVRKTLTAKLTGWMPKKGVTYKYQWLFGGKNVSGATGKTYVPKSAGLVNLRVTATVPGQSHSITYMTGAVSIKGEPAPPSPPANLADLRTAFNNRMLELVNAERKSLGLSGLASHDSQLRPGADQWVTKQAADQTVDHSPASFWIGLGVTQTPSENLGQIATLPAIVHGVSSIPQVKEMAERAFANWKGSPSHFAIMTVNGPQKLWSTFATGYDSFYKKDVTVVILVVRNDYGG